jgi:hypothetical protein
MTRKVESYTLPAYWASYLINCDASGLDESEKEQADKFLAENGLPFPVGCSEESWFSWHNDSGNGLGGDVMKFAFVSESTT